MDNRPLTSKEYWLRQGGPFEPFRVEGHEFADVLERYLPADPSLSCAEIGAYPGRNLCYLAGRFGYRPVAIEYREDAGDILTLLRFNGIGNGELVNEDLFRVEGRTFDVVASFGFVEHFADAGDVIRRHAEMVRPGGYLVLSVPHFRGLQGMLRRLVFTREALRDLYGSHNFGIMHLSRLERAISRTGMQVLYGGYRMGCRFWFDPGSPRIRRSMRRVVELYRAFERRFGRKLPSSALYSPMILTISRKAA